MSTTVIRSYAKINVCLNVVGKRSDNYHELDMVMLPLELHDSILISKLKESAKDNYITIDDYSLAAEQYNTVSKAMERLQKKYNFSQKFSIFVHKNIPIQAGLGGGSSNAAFTVKAINEILKLGASIEDMEHICEKLGGDVPFFVKCKPCRCTGIGEIVNPIEIKNNYYVLLVKPQAGCSTEKIYTIADDMKLNIYDIDKVIECLKEGNDEELVNYIGNSLEAPAESLVPEINSVLTKMKALGLNISGMSGSGSCCFALSTDKSLIKKAAKQFDDDLYTVITTKVLK